MKSARILWLHRQTSAVGEYRCQAPARELKRRGYDITVFDKPYTSLKPDLHSWLGANLGKYDLLMVDRTTSQAELPLLAGFRHASPGMRMVVDSDDDWTDVPWWNQAQSNYKPGMTMYEAGKAHYKLSELLTVSTPTLVEVFRERAHAVALCPNGIDPSIWDSLEVSPERGRDPHLRILYGGASGHYGDMDEARLGLEAVLQNPPTPFRLICFGAIPAWLHTLAEQFPSRVVRLPWTEFSDYPSAVAWGGFDGAIAPLREHPFNNSKSNIKWLEAGIQGIPFLCSDVGPYKDIPQGCALKVSNTAAQWSGSLRALLEDASLREKLRSKAREAILDTGTIDKTAPAWEEAIELAMSRPRIETLEDTRLPSEVKHLESAHSPGSSSQPSDSATDSGRDDRGGSLASRGR